MPAADARSPSLTDLHVDRASDRELVVTRAFAAPASLVYDAWTKPGLLKRWWAPRSFGVSLYDCTVELRVGGRYRYVFGKEGQPRMAFSGTFREVEPNARLVTSQLFEQMPDAGEAIVTATFVEAGRVTRLELRQLFASKAACDGAVASGMTDGMRITFDQLAALLIAPASPSPAR